MEEMHKNKLERSPLQLALVQVRFSPVASMREYVPPFQEWLRKSGFPGFERQQIQHFNFGPEPSTESSSLWSFLSKGKRERVALTEDFVIYETSDYDVIEVFLARVEEILDKLNSIVQVGFITRIGLRYVDVITELDGHPPAWFLKDQIQGLLFDDGADTVVTNQFQSLVRTSEGKLRVRALQGSGPDFMPPDLKPEGIEYGLKLTNEDSFRILDFDHIWDGEIDFDQIGRAHV